MKYILPDGMTPEELERIARVMQDTSRIHLLSIQQLQRWAEEMRCAARAEEKP